MRSLMAEKIVHKKANGRGIHVIPLHSLLNGACSCLNPKCRDVAKHPISAWKNKAVNNVTHVREIWNTHSYANIGVVTGKTSGIFVVDVDGEEGQSTILDWVLEHGEMPATYQVNTGRGYHLYYKCPKFDVPTLRGSLGAGIDIRGEEGYVVGAGSVHRNGKIYTCVRDIEFADAPKFLLEMIQEREILKVDASGINIKGYSRVDVIEELEREASRNKWLRDILTGRKSFDTHSELDMSLSNCLVVNGWTDKEIASALYGLRVEWGEKEKHQGYYASTIAKSHKWREKNMQNVVVLDDVEEIVEIPSDPEVKAFPTHVFPKGVREFIDAVARGVQVPPDLVGVHVLVVCGAGIGATRRIQVKDGWQEQPNLFAMVVAEPGTGKSPALAKVFQPVLKMQTALKEKYDAELVDYHKTLKESDQDESQPPVMSELYVTSATIEAMNNVMSLNPRGIISKVDELAGTFKSWGQYKGGRGDDEESMLSNWSGTDIKINRVGKPPLVIPKPFCAITGNITPATVSKFEGEKEDNGLLHRFLISYPEKQKTPRWTKEGVPFYIADGYEHVLRALYRLDFREEHDVLYMSEGAEKMFADWYDRIMSEMDKEDFPKKLRGVWAKMPAQVARIALIVQMVWGVCGQASKNEIEKVVMERAITLAEYFMSHARKVYFYLGDSANDARIMEAIDFIKKQGGEVTRTEIRRKRVAGCKKASEVDGLFDELTDLGYGKVGKTAINGAGRPSISFKLF